MRVTLGTSRVVGCSISDGFFPAAGEHVGTESGGFLNAFALLNVPWRRLHRMLTTRRHRRRSRLGDWRNTPGLGSSSCRRRPPGRPPGRRAASRARTAMEVTAQPRTPDRVPARGPVLRTRTASGHRGSLSPRLISYKSEQRPAHLSKGYKPDATCGNTPDSVPRLSHDQRPAPAYSGMRLLPPTPDTTTAPNP